jgi:hypothetical protein
LIIEGVNDGAARGTFMTVTAIISLKAHPGQRDLLLQAMAGLDELMPLLAAEINTVHYTGHCFGE